jgi:uncharacterized membrane protein YdjX (TVP38/TMEM64 family)
MQRIKTNLPRNISTWLWWAGIALVVILLLWLGGRELAPIINFLKDRQQIEAFLAGWGIWGPLLYVLILTVQVFTAVIPGQVLMITAGYLYGFWGGFALNFFTIVVTSQIAFAFARKAGKPAVERFVPDNIWERWGDIAKRGNFFFFLICFWFPIIPSSATNYIAGLSHISGWLFFLASVLGRLPGIVLITLIGSHGLTLTWQQWVVIIPLAILLIIGGRYLTGKIERRLQSSG